ncbi:hypothetical protein TNIN_22941 [Trichonephila inaurata madagascariensis]|uniref:Uncharacterized protein n=1 Tax=Trichonephila inaurata madagascariensis TaxID=2747483 RepID=A0A8X6X8R1_9ARAC|nr:hypothetical protein TNIN_22941 [Trichonephila inaurata madagascariensis]
MTGSNVLNLVRIDLLRYLKLHQPRQNSIFAADGCDCQRAVGPPWNSNQAIHSHRFFRQLLQKRKISGKVLTFITTVMKTSRVPFTELKQA